MHTRRSLRSRILFWLAGYAVLLTIGISLHGFLINEYAERLLWDSLMRNEFEHHLERQKNIPGYHWYDSESLHLYVEGSERPPPAVFDGYGDGIHDELVMPDGTEMLILVERVDGVRHVLSLDITEMENEEDKLTLLIFGSAILLVTSMGAFLAFGVGRAIAPLTRLAARITSLRPDQRGKRIEVEARASREVAVIADAFNGYLQRNEHFVERERTFINSASHELRTPIAVLTGAAELALQEAGDPAAVRHQLQRIQRMAQDMEQLVTLLLALAKDPSRLDQASEPVALETLLPGIVEDHRHLTEGKSLQLRLATVPAATIHAPPGIVRAAIGNLLRNAIEHSDSGTIDITLQADATVVITDPGHGMTPEQISTIWSQLARGGGVDGGGIGLDLIARLCEHLGWRLDIRSDPEHGTIATLALRG